MFFNKRKGRRIDRRHPFLSVSQLNRTVEQSGRNVGGALSLNSVVGNLTRRQLQRPGVTPPVISMFEVQDECSPAVDGVYICYKQSAAGLWGEIEYIVLNLIENDTIAAYEPALAYQDRIAGWRMADENGTVRWVGTPVTPPVRMARITAPSGGGTSVVCNLIANDGETEIISGLGSGITVHFSITMTALLNAALPRFKDGDHLFAENIAGKWWCAQLFQASENCICSE